MKPVVFQLEDLEKLQELLDFLDADAFRSIEDFSRLCRHNTIQLQDGRVAVVFVTGIVVYNSRADLITAIEDQSINDFLYLDATRSKSVDEKLNDTDFNQWLLDSIHYYRELDFFSEYKDYSDLEIIHEITCHPSRGNAHWLFDRSFDLSLHEANLCLLSWDLKRVWWDDMECSICFQNNVYPYLLSQWSGISRGCFLPQDIREIWQTEVGPIQIEFSLDGQQYCLEVAYKNDWLDLNILSEINRLISSTGYRFEFCPTESQNLFSVVLKPDEKEKLQDQGVRFLA